VQSGCNEVALPSPSHHPLAPPHRCRQIPDCGGQRFDYLAYYRRDPDVAALLAGYVMVEERGMFRYWRRAEAPPAPPR
jgi:hypothetical protein